MLHEKKKSNSPTRNPKTSPRVNYYESASIGFSTFISVFQWWDCSGLVDGELHKSHSGFVGDGLPKDEIALGGVPNWCVGLVDGVAGLYGAPVVKNEK
jgi:hypothetical protein